MRTRPIPGAVEALERRTLLASVTVGANIDVSKLAGYQAQGSIAVDPTNPSRQFVAANNATNVGLFAAYSTNGGATWTTRTMAGGSDGLPVAAGDASDAFDSFGNLFLTYLKTTGTPAAVVVRSTNAGQSFTLVTSFNNAADEPSIATGPGNVANTASVWVTWLGSSGLLAAGAQVTGLNAVGSFTSSQTVPGGTLGNFGDVAIGPGGKVMVTWQDNTGGEGASNIFVAVDSNGVGSGGFASAILATTTNVGGFDFVPAQPRRSIDAEAGLAWDRTAGAHAGRVYLVYTNEFPDESNDTDVLVRFSDNNGSTWSSPVRVNDDATTRSQILPRIALDQTSGTLAATWLDARNSATNDAVQLWGAVSTTGGASFDTNVQISAGSSLATAQSNTRDFGDYTGLAFVNGTFYPLWPDNSSSLVGNPDPPNFDVATATVAVAAGPPGNDNFANARPIVANSAVGTNVSATKEAGEPDHAGVAGGKSVWWTWIAPTSQSYVLSTAGSSFDTLLAVYTGGSVAALTHVASNDNATPLSTSRIVFNAVAGTTYPIAVDGVAGASGDIVLALALAQHTISGSVYVDRDSSGARDAGEPPLANRTVYLDANDNGIFDSATIDAPSQDVPEAIPDLGTIVSTLSLANVAGAIADVNVTLDISHTFDDDLDVYLVSPAGTRVELFTEVGGAGHDFSGTTLDDEALTPITAGAAPFTGIFRPEGTLSSLDGQDPNGTWTLQVSDDLTDDVGTLNNWSLMLTAAEASTSTDAAGNYSFNGLASGAYRVRVAAPASPAYLPIAPAPGVARAVSLSLEQSAASQDFGFFPLGFTGSAGNDQYTLSTLNNGSLIRIVESLFTQPVATYTIPPATLAAASASLTFDAERGDDTLTIDLLDGNPVPAAGVTFTGGSNSPAGDSLTVLGSTSSDDVAFAPASTVINATTTVTTAGVERENFDGRGGLDHVALDSGASVTFPNSQHLASLTLADNTSPAMTPDGHNMLYTQSLALAPTARLDLADNDLLLDYSTVSPIGTWTGSTYDGVTALIASARNGGTWTGPGITSSTAAAHGGLTTLAVAEASQALGLSAFATTTYEGETVDGTTVIVKYTYAADATLDGKINVDDYGRIDFNVNLGTSAWFNGDFNYDGKINVDDYGIIDFNVALQGLPL